MKNILKVTRDELAASRDVPVAIFENDEYLYFQMAGEMLREILKNNVAGKRTVFIVPVGPTGQYKYFADMVNTLRIDLKNVWFFNMDEYMLDERTLIPSDDRLSFIGFMQKKVYSRIDPELIMPEDQRIFPLPDRAAQIAELLEKLGGADVCFGGIGMNGHIAFNEPPESGENMDEEQYKKLSVRTIKIARETVAVNCVNALGGRLEGFPRYAATIGMKQILDSKKIRLYCFRELHRAVVREFAFGGVSTACPVTLLKNHKDVRLNITEYVAMMP